VLLPEKPTVEAHPRRPLVKLFQNERSVVCCNTSGQEREGQGTAWQSQNDLEFSELS
jgi:hypothetical protein